MNRSCPMPGGARFPPSTVGPTPLSAADELMDLESRFPYREGNGPPPTSLGQA